MDVSNVQAELGTLELKLDELSVQTLNLDDSKFGQDRKQGPH